VNLDDEEAGLDHRIFAGETLDLLLGGHMINGEPVDLTGAAGGAVEVDDACW